MTTIPEHIDLIASDLMKAEYEDDWAMYVAISQALLAAEKRGREEAAGVAQECSKNVSGPTTREAICAEVASAIRSGS